MDELSSLRREVRRLHEDHKILNNNLEQLRVEEKFDIQQSPYKVECWQHYTKITIYYVSVYTQNGITTNLAKVFCASLFREVPEDKIKVRPKKTLTAVDTRPYFQFDTPYTEEVQKSHVTSNRYLMNIPT